MNDADAKASKAEKIRRDASLPMGDIQSNPISALGYKKLKDPKTGIVKVGDVDDFEERGSYNPVKNKMALNSVTLRNKPKLRDDVAKHELGHAASHALNPEPQQSTSHASKARATNKELETLRDKEENRQRRLDLTHSKDRTHRAAASSWSSNMHDRDQIALDKDNEALKNKARKTLYKAYGAPDRATMSDRDLGKTATGTIIPEETYMTIKERFYANLNMIREGIEKGNPNIVRLNATRRAAKRALPHVKKNRYEEAHAAVEGTALEKPLKSYLDRAQKHWTKMNVLNNKAGKTSTSSDDYDKLRSRANDHQDRAQHHHGKAVEYLKSWSSDTMPN